MRRLTPLALLLATPALAEDEACFELGGQGASPCATPGGKVAVESNLIDWARDGHGADREDRVELAETIVRIGLRGSTEARVTWTPLVLQRPRGGPAGRGIGDLILGAKHQFGSNTGPVGLLVEARLPTASNGVGQETWSLRGGLLGQFELGDSVKLDLTATVEAAADEDRRGRHLAASMVGGCDLDLSADVTLTADVRVLRDNDPMQHTTEATASLSLSRMLGDNTQATLQGVAGLNHDAPPVELVAGIAFRF